MSTVSQIITEIDDKVFENDEELIRGDDMNEILKMIANSYANKDDGGLVFSSEVGTSTDLNYASLSDNAFITKKQFEDNVPSPDLSDYYRNDGNSFGLDAELGTNDNHSLNIKTNNTVRLAITSSGPVVYNSASSGNTSAWKYKSFGSTSGSYAYEWFNSSNTPLASLRNDGEFDVLSAYLLDGFRVLKYNDALGNLQVGPSAWDVTTAGAGNLAIGRNNMTNLGPGGTHNTVVGQSCGVSIVGGYYNTIIGFASGNNEDMVGCLFFGEMADSLKGDVTSDSQAFGSLAAVRDNNELVHGANGREIKNIFYGAGQGASSSGERVNTFLDVSIHAQGDTEGINTDASGASFNLRPHRGTGNTKSASTRLQFSPAGISGNQTNAWQNGLILNGDGDIILHRNLYINGKDQLGSIWFKPVTGGLEIWYHNGTSYQLLTSDTI